MEINIDGWLEGNTPVLSPNFDVRPQGTEIDLLVIHCISLPEGVYQHNYVEQLFTNTLDCTVDATFSSLVDLKVSAHFLIRRNGQLIQFVSTQNRAWHAGVSSFKGRDNCNDFSIGIELEGTDHSEFEPEQYSVLNKLIKAICQKYPLITPNRIVGHSDIAPGRKTDPGVKFDWSQLIF